MVVLEHVGEYLAKPNADRIENDFASIGGFLRKCSITVPEILYIDPGKDWLLIEDFGDITLDRACACEGPRGHTALYFAAMETLVKFAASTVNARKEAICAAQRVLDLDTMVWEMQHFVEWWMEAEGNAPNTTDREFINCKLRALAGELCESPTVLVHRDYHSRNLMVLGDGIGVIDFQDALLGPPTYDLASLLLDCYVDADWQYIDGAVATFREMLISAGLSDISEARFRRQFIVQGLQRSMKAAGRHNFLAHRLGREEDRVAARRGVATLASLLQRFDDFAQLRCVMGKYVKVLLEV